MATMDIFAGANLTVEVGTHTPGSKTPLLISKKFQKLVHSLPLVRKT